MSQCLLMYFTLVSEQLLSRILIICTLSRLINVSLLIIQEIINEKIILSIFQRV